MTIKPILVFALVGLTGPAFAQDSSTLNIDGANMVTEIAAPSHMENVDTIYSGWRFRSTETQELELDDFDNPAFVFIDQGMDFWNKVEVAPVKPAPVATPMSKTLPGCARPCQGLKAANLCQWKI